MSVKSILYVFGGEAHELNALSSALALAGASRAFLRILHIAAPPILPDALGIGNYAVAAYGDRSIIDVLEKDARELTERASAYVTDYCRREAVSLQADGSTPVMGQSRAVFRVVTGVPDICLASEAYLQDLVVGAHDNRPGGDFTTILTTLFAANRPILLLPRVPGAPLSETGFARKFVFAWDGSRTSARALQAAVPYMLHAEQVHLLGIGEDKGGDMISEADVQTYLRSHCVAAEFVHAQRQNRDIGDAVLNEAAALGADLLAMGAYGHGHVGEMLLGGVTDHVLKHGRLPLLLAR